jgi:hypothetical protein
MKNELKYALIGGGILLAIYIILQIILLIFLSSTSFCLICAGFLIFLDFIPLLILNVKGWSAYFISAIFYFLIGALVGFLVQKFKK